MKILQILSVNSSIYNVDSDESISIKELVKKLLNNNEWCVVALVRILS